MHSHVFFLNLNINWKVISEASKRLSTSHKKTPARSQNLLSLLINVFSILCALLLHFWLYNVNNWAMGLNIFFVHKLLSTIMYTGNRYTYLDYFTPCFHCGLGKYLLGISEQGYACMVVIVHNVHPNAFKYKIKMQIKVMKRMIANEVAVEAAFIIISLKRNIKSLEHGEIPSIPRRPVVFQYLIDWGIIKRKQRWSFLCAILFLSAKQESLLTEEKKQYLVFERFHYKRYYWILFYRCGVI